MLLWTCMRFLPVGRLGAVWRAVLGPYVYIYIYIYIYIYYYGYTARSFASDPRAAFDVCRLLNGHTPPSFAFDP
jgi:hypothetical protein